MNQESSFNLKSKAQFIFYCFNFSIVKETNILVLITFPSQFPEECPSIIIENQDCLMNILPLLLISIKYLVKQWLVNPIYKECASEDGRYINYTKFSKEAEKWATHKQFVFLI